MAVPLLDLKPQNLPLEPELTAAFLRVLRSGHYIMGPELERFEADMARLLGVRHALGVSSGTDAILLALMALGIGPGDEVIVPSFTFFATGGCVSRVGARPVFADACPVCFNLEVSDAARRITPRTKAIMPVHLYGQAADLDAIGALAARHGLHLIEDGAQALGAKYRGRAVGGFGAFGTFSFFPSKNLGALGDAGLLVTQDDALAEKARLLRLHGAKPKYYHHLVGANFRMDALQAAFLSVKAARYDDYTEARRRNAADYTAQLSGLPGVVVADPARCGCVESRGGGQEADIRMVLPVAYPHNEHIWNQYTVRVLGEGRRDALRNHLQARGIGTEIYYPVPLHAQPCFSPAVGAAQELPVCERLAREVLSLPIYPELTAAQRSEVVLGLRDFLVAG
ncbi:MAG: DegT/DnrJ/EryC1/StrS family aminotransferase [Verrucomicrobiales bacterium]|nr:DegT/DnrJ/EryC1/StrS family aminotransferase [Verrucomicrobiales bacterium]